jgi:hypothetical protein
MLQTIRNQGKDGETGGEVAEDRTWLKNGLKIPGT